ncbi:HAD family hydrolase [Sediminibacterium ginsengisoli]|uniref:Putative hydrolase of the HAD superfamily n=1 Tax=Sediminibacterium ginsengisoli TaxID=413434 RepID=A0A1T4M6I5_9BACT|nr:HAD family phosphatase [Sediminibacterium ginsengisoli]SJZ62630.1 putative hydrolase of the HAD superfamily [Sediminibacterium ginsengisoli]
MNPVRNIIFDLGGIFLNLDYTRTEKAFEALGIKDFRSMFAQHHSNPLFEDLETGKLSPEGFYNAFRQATGTVITDLEIRDAWNALLLDFTEERLLWLEEIGKKYRIFLFSNTNQIHADHFLNQFSQLNTGRHFNDYFIKAYYSQELGLRKPHVASYRKILELENLEPAETLFIDDTAVNIEGAKQAGLQTIHLVAPRTVLDLEL